MMAPIVIVGDGTKVVLLWWLLLLIILTIVELFSNYKKKITIRIEGG